MTTLNNRADDWEDISVKKELFEIGKSVDAAIEAACEKLGCPRDECEWEIIDLPKKGFFGLKNTPAKVRVSIEVPDEKPVVTQQKPNELQKPREAQKPRETQKPAEKQQKHEPSKPEGIKESEASEKEKKAKEYLAEVLEAAGLKAEYVVTREHGGSCINIVGDGLGMIIGRRGETLDAIQYLSGLVANRSGGDYLRLTIDCGDYRLKRKDTLEDLAKKLAGQVIKTNVSRTLEPMNPFERRIIHATVSEIEGVSSSSIGEEPNRRVVITSPTARPASAGGYKTDSRRDGYNRNRGARDSRPPSRQAGASESGGERPPRPPREGGERGGYNRGGRGGRDDRRGSGGSNRPPRPSTAVPQGPPKKTPEAEAITGLSFGKIDLE